MSTKMDNKEFLNTEDEDINFEHVSEKKSDIDFDLIVTSLEELIFSPEFTEKQAQFCLANCDKFDESKEMKLEYTEIFKEYNNLIEGLIQDKLKNVIPNFSFDKLEEFLISNKDILSGDVFDTLLSLGDFLEFKDLMLSYKNQGNTDLSAGSSKGGLGLAITGHNIDSNN